MQQTPTAIATGTATATRAGGGGDPTGLNPMSFTDQHGNVVLDRLRHQRDSGRFCDVSLSVNNRHFPAHRNVLAACSPYFDSILKNSKVVKEQVTVNCQNPNVFELLLNYMYTGSVVIDRGSVTELLKLANNFLVTKLKNYCAEYLDRYLDAVNCLAVKELAAKYNMPGLLKNACDYLEANINRCLLESTDILDYSLIQVKNFLHDPNYRIGISPDVHLKFVARWVAQNVLQRECLLKDLLSMTPVTRISQQTFENLLDFHPLFEKSEQCRFALLRSMYEHNLSIVKYERQYRALIAKLSGEMDAYFNSSQLDSLFVNNHDDSHPPTLVHHNAGDEQLGNGLGEVPATSSFSNSFGHNEHQRDNGVLRSADESEQDSAHLLQPEETYRYSVDQQPSFQQTDTVEQEGMGTSTSTFIAPQVREDQYVAAVAARPGLKVTLRLPSLMMNRKNRLLGKSLMSAGRHKLYRKTVSTANQILQKRRGRPRKFRPRLRFNIAGDAKVGSAHLSDDERLYPDCGVDLDDAVIFEDEEEIDPSLINDDDEVEESDENPLERDGAAGGSGVGDVDHYLPQMVFRCPHCIYTANSQTRVSSHVARAHSRNVIYVCSLCPFECKWNRQYYTHMKTHFEGPPFQCDMCDYSADRIQMLLSHRMKHTNERPFKCTQCEYRCRTKTNLIAHFRSHTGEKPFHCHECGRGFAIKSTLDQHLATHSDTRPYQCDECDFSTKYQSHLISHKRIHTGDVFHCQFADCSYSSPKKSQLAAHLRTHLAVRSHQCNICNRSFIEKSHLVRHERIHLADKPFKCENCEYASSRRDKLKEHIQKHHSQATNNKQHRRRYRRAKQLAQLAAQAKVVPDPSSTLFRPINPTIGGSDSPDSMPGSSAIPDSPLPNQSGNVAATAASSRGATMPAPAPPVAAGVVDFSNLMSQLNHRPSSVPQTAAIALSPSLSLNLNLFGCDSPLIDGMRKDVVLGGNLVPTPVPIEPPELTTPLPLPRHTEEFMAHTPPGELQRPMSEPLLNQLTSPWYHRSYTPNDES